MSEKVNVLISWPEVVGNYGWKHVRKNSCTKNITNMHKEYNKY